MTTSQAWQLAREAAERYEAILVPAILGPFARALVDGSDLKADQTVLDVGCGTGAATRRAAERVGPSGRVIGVELSAGMLEVAKSLLPVQGAPIEWCEASAYRLPLDDESVDVVLCAQTLQFLSDRPLALWEMRRVLKPGGYVALSLWCALPENPYFHALVDAVSRHIGPDTAAGLEAAFALTGVTAIRKVLGEHFNHVEMTVVQLELALLELSAFVPRHVSATPMAAGFSAAPEDVQRAVIAEVAERLAYFEADSRARIPFRSHLARAEK